ncbi:MAG: ABC transporter permease [Paracoccus sp. (in: a-proteobacteria)]|uniref:ABC transporter permease n=1 Tax=Paracoccus sp. TaxID=267 RepID=UPI0039E5EB99
MTSYADIATDTPPGAAPEAGAASPHNAPARRVRRRLGPGPAIPFGLALGPALILVIWTAGSALGWIDDRTLPAPWTVIATFGKLISDGRLQDNLTVSAGRAFLGLAIGVTVGLTLALIAGLSRLGEALVDGPVQINRAVPTLALIPLMILWFGIGEFMKIITIVLAVLIPIYIHTHNALRSIDSRYVELAETLRMSQRDFILQVVLPGSLPGFLLGLRFAVTLCWVSLVVVEQVNATNGLGYMIDLARSYGQIDIIFVGLVVYAVLGLVSDGAVRLLQRRLLSWRRTLDH